jgi:hypothetical protein
MLNKDSESKYKIKLHWHNLYIPDMEVNIFSDPRYTLKWKLIYSQISDILQNGS